MLLGALVVLTRSDRAAPTGPAPAVPPPTGPEPATPPPKGPAPAAPAPTGPAPAALPPARVPTIPDRTDVQSPGEAQPDHIEAPVITGVAVAGLQATLSWSWTRTRAWDQVEMRVYRSRRDSGTGRFTGEELVGEERLPSDREVDGALRGSVSNRLPAAGLYAFRLEVVARDRPVTRPAAGLGYDTIWYAWKREKVLVGAEDWSVVPLPGLGGDLLHDARDPRFAFFFELYRGPSLVRDCGVDYRVGWPAPTHGHDCDWESGERSIILDNPEPGAPGAWRLSFAWADDETPFHHVDLQSAFRDDGVPDGSMAGKSRPRGSK
jgi:hypothetical protein